MGHRKKSASAYIPPPPISFNEDGGFVIYNISGYSSCGLATGPRLSEVLCLFRVETDFLLFTNFGGHISKLDNETKFWRIPGELGKLFGGSLQVGHWFTSMWTEKTTAQESETEEPLVYVEHSWLFDHTNRRVLKDQLVGRATELARRHDQSRFICRISGATAVYNDDGVPIQDVPDLAVIEELWLSMAADRSSRSDSNYQSTYIVPCTNPQRAPSEVRWTGPASISGMRFMAGIGAHRFVTQGSDRALPRKAIEL